MSLFQQSVQKKFIKDLDKAKVETAYQKLIAHFGNFDVQENIRKAKEEQYQEGFLRELFVDVLGYVLNPQPNYNLITEQKNEKNSKKADGAILKNGKPIAVIELKSVKTTDLQSIEIQAFNYKNNQTECIYVITSNFQKLRFYIENAVDFEEFDLFDLSKERFDLLYLCLHVDNVLSDLPLRIKQASLEREENITKKLYADYSLFKQALFKDISAQNKSKGFKPLELLKKTQKLLDRFLFIFFAEDKGLLPPNSVSEILNQWDKLKELDAYQPLYNRFKLYFGYLNNGHKGKVYDIFAYNGGLFAPDDLLDNFIITDGVLYQHCRVLSHYDFDTEVDTNILGHIFEHSLNEVDEVAANTEGVSLDKGKTKRKKDGIFYTPRYITKYIVESTVGELCKQKKLILGLDNEALIKADTKKDRKLYQAKIDEYRKWLLQLTILDPACGSGAFLNQAFEFLLQEHGLIDSMSAMLFGDSLVMTDNVTEILENNIYGVDINEESVEIARLALWLRTAKVGRKLSDLSRNIKCGNSLISDPSVAGDLAFDWHKAFPKVFRNKNKEGFHVVLTTHNSRTSKRMIAYNIEKGEPLEFTLEDEIAMTKIMRNIILEKNYNCMAYNICKDHVHLILVCEYSELTNIVKTIKGKSAYLYNRRDSNGLKPIGNNTSPIGNTQSNGFQPIAQPSTPVWSQKFFRAFLDSWELAELSKKPGWLYDDTYLDNAISYVQTNRYKHNLPQSDELDAIIASFCKNTEGAYANEITGGFDVVIGNPPYVQSHSISENEKTFYYNNYVTAEYQINTYALFIEKIFGLLKKEGYYAYIVPNYFLSTQNDRKLRHLIFIKNHALEILNTYSVFESATVDTLILVGTNSNISAKNTAIRSVSPNCKSILERLEQIGNKQFFFDENRLFDAFQEDDIVISFDTQLELNGQYRLSDFFEFYQGMKPYEQGKGKPTQTREMMNNKIYHATHKVDDSYLPLLTASSIKRYSTVWEGNWIKYGVNLAAPRKKEIFEGERLLLNRIVSKDKLDITYEFETKINNTDVFNLKPKKDTIVTFSTKSLLAIIASKLCAVYFKKQNINLNRDVFPKINVNTLESFPIPNISNDLCEELSLLSDNMLDYHATIQKQSTRFIKLFTSMSNPMGLNPLGLTINKKLETWYNLTFGEFRKELEKQKIAIPIKELMDYQDLFDTNATQIKEIQTKITHTEKAIDKLVYALYDLTSEEIQIIENQ